MSAVRPLREQVSEEEHEVDRDNAAADALTLRVPPTGRLSWLIPLLLVLATAGLFVANHRHEMGASTGEDARTVVSDHVKSLLTYTYADIDSDLAAEKDWLTGPFADQYADLVTTKIGPAARRAEVSTSAAIASAGVVAAHPDRVQLLLFVNVTTTSSELSEPRVSGSRLLVTADLVDGAWRISALDPV